MIGAETHPREHPLTFHDLWKVNTGSEVGLEWRQNSRFSPGQTGEPRSQGTAHHSDHAVSRYPGPYGGLKGGAVSNQRDWHFIAEQPAPAPHLAHSFGCAATLPYALC